MASRSSHPALSHADSFATGSAEVLQFVGRILLGSLSLLIGGGKLTKVPATVIHYTELGIPNPDMMTYLVGSFEVFLGVALILGLATRYAALAYFLFALAAAAIAHRYWTYPETAQGAQYSNFARNLATMSAALFVFVTGAGRFSVDAMLTRKR
jgi:putative oxidoreductase